MGEYFKSESSPKQAFRALIRTVCQSWPRAGPDSRPELIMMIWKDFAYLSFVFYIYGTGTVGLEEI